jgi:hypothetical protein
MPSPTAESPVRVKEWVTLDEAAWWVHFNDWPTDANRDLSGWLCWAATDPSIARDMVLAFWRQGLLEARGYTRFNDPGAPRILPSGSAKRPLNIRWKHSMALEPKDGRIDGVQVVWAWAIEISAASLTVLLKIPPLQEQTVSAELGTDASAAPLDANIKPRKKTGKSASKRPDVLDFLVELGSEVDKFESARELARHYVETRRAQGRAHAEWSYARDVINEALKKTARVGLTDIKK